MKRTAWTVIRDAADSDWDSVGRDDLDPAMNGFDHWFLDENWQSGPLSWAVWEELETIHEEHGRATWLSP